MRRTVPARATRFWTQSTMRCFESVSIRKRYPSWRRDLPFRRMLLARFPYLIFYAVADGSVEVHAIAHTSRRPGYWLKR